MKIISNFNRRDKMIQFYCFSSALLIIPAIGCASTPKAVPSIKSRLGFYQSDPQNSTFYLVLPVPAIFPVIPDIKTSQDSQKLLGDVVVHVGVDSNGNLLKIMAISGDTNLQKAAEAWVNRVKFRPGYMLKAGNERGTLFPVYFYITITWTEKNNKFRISFDNK